MNAHIKQQLKIIFLKSASPEKLMKCLLFVKPLEKSNLNESTSKIDQTFDKCTACDENNVAERSCSECEENLCDLCQKAYLRVKLTKNHSLVSLNKEN